MLNDELISSFECLLHLMHNPPGDFIILEDQNRDIHSKITLKTCSMMSLEINLKIKDKDINLKFEDFPIYVYHNIIARLTPIYNKLVYIESHQEHSNHILLMNYSSIISNCILMLGDNSLIKTENMISNLIPNQFKNDIIIVCGPIGDFFVLTIHFVKLLGDSIDNSPSMTLWHQYVPDTKINHLGHEYLILDSCLMKYKYKSQTNLLLQLKSIQMQLSSISTCLSINEN